MGEGSLASHGIPRVKRFSENIGQDFISLHRFHPMKKWMKNVTVSELPVSSLPHGLTTAL
jgi:hypothetical protein